MNVAAILVLFAVLGPIAPEAQLSEWEQEYLPQASGCNLDYATHAECVSCCYRKSRAAGYVCNIVAGMNCSGIWCQAGCGALVALARGACLGHNCRGKTGDPGCRPPLPPCPRCMVFCGPGRSSACGDCSEGKVCCD